MLLSRTARGVLFRLLTLRISARRAHGPRNLARVAVTRSLPQTLHGEAQPQLRRQHLSQQAKLVGRRERFESSAQFSHAIGSGSHHCQQLPLFARKS